MRPCILTIAGSDCGAGAGIQSDSRVIQVLGGFALTAITALTAQNGSGVIAWEPVLPKQLEQQIEATVSGFPIAAAKTGLLPSASAITAIVRLLPREVPLIVDPILGSTSGTVFLNEKGRHALLRTLLPRATLVTPNWPEAAALTGVKVCDTTTAREAALRLIERGARAVLIKGGHGKRALVEDLLLCADGSEVAFASERIQTPNTHGTGCVLSAAITTLVGQGVALVPAIEQARRFLNVALEQGAEGEWQGRGPAFPGW
jgi:hydroxymethylpyrimidine/phosphomethylpyrimidine kinase